MPNPAAAETIPLHPLTLPRLAKASTATVATLLYKRGYHNAFVQGIAPLTAGRAPMVGPAFTLRYIPARPDTDPIGAFREPDHPQRVAVETCPEGAVLVMDCRQDASAASAGSILLTRLQLRGAAGVVTDGGIRDVAGAAALEMPVFAAGPSAPTNLTKHHAIDIGLPIACGGVAVYPGDIILGDGDGVMVIPRHLAGEVAAESVGMERFEAFVLEEVLRGVPIIGLYPPTDPDTKARFEVWQARGEV
ncbi:ribonuclease activity regulator RraA [Cereibacter changlensis]|uniref:Ribonuclease activity regulator RraA n=1 Tax=Cereibacter changlensis TaxID=402884 RepID=A0A4U0Z2M8_9RHOB|nr:ribonuclease activity regulator RraA [Cereibacter changlensis]TKA97396.1 ribonuclease activity regulator RraA [Cereibacter changlensis]